MASPQPSPVLLVILDGFGVAPAGPGNAITLAQPPYWESLLASCPHTTLEPGGLAVGLPEGQFGNSEVGHLNLGAGRVVYQDIARIDQAIKDGSFFANPALARTQQAIAKGKRVHLMGLVSDGGVHSSDRHYLALLRYFRKLGTPADRICFHIITDGRDTAQKGGYAYVKTLLAHMQAEGIGRIVSLSGRYYAMDRDRNWDRSAKYWDVVVRNKGVPDHDVLKSIERNYQAGVFDEFIPPVGIAPVGQKPVTIEDGDAVLWFNFRADRARQFCRALTEGDAFDSQCFARGVRPQIDLVTMTHYLDGLRATVAYAQTGIANTLGEYLSKRGRRQFRCAETEKYAHVTYFFNGGVEPPYTGEERGLIPSPKVATYDLQPEMSLPSVADAVMMALHARRYDFVLTNFANGDMVGHTGNIQAAQIAVHAIDKHLRRVVATAHQSGYEVLITADHGNCDEMLGPQGEVLTNHSFNPVPFIYAPLRDGEYRLREGGVLADVAPTVLGLMGEAQPPEMTGRNLILQEGS